MKPRMFPLLALILGVMLSLALGAPRASADTPSRLDAPTPSTPAACQSATWDAAGCTKAIADRRAAHQASATAQSTDTQPVSGALLWLVLLALYFLPSLIAGTRHHHQTAAIVALNLLFGWTVIGWGIAIIWALTAIPGTRQAPTPSAPSLVDAIQSGQ